MDSRGQHCLFSPEKDITPFTTPCDTSDRNNSSVIPQENNPKHLYSTPVSVIRHTESQVAKRKLTFGVNCDQTNIEERSSALQLQSSANRPPRGRPSAKDKRELHRLGAASKFRCPECPMGFQRKKSLATHMLTHCDVRRHDCTYPECSKRFTQYSHLTTHWRVHTREKPFVCTGQNCSSRSTFKKGKCIYHPENEFIRQNEAPEKIMERMGSNQENLSEDEVTWIIEHIAKKKVTPAPQENSMDVLTGAKNLIFFSNNCHAKFEQSNSC